MIIWDEKLVRENQVEWGINDLKAGVIKYGTKKYKFQMFNDSLLSSHY